MEKKRYAILDALRGFAYAAGFCLLFDRRPEAKGWLLLSRPGRMAMDEVFPLRTGGMGVADAHVWKNTAAYHFFEKRVGLITRENHPQLACLLPPSFLSIAIVSVPII